MQLQQLPNIGLLKTLFVNLKCASLKDALKMPILIARNVNVKYCRRKVFQFTDGVRPAMVTVGFNRHCNNGYRSTLSIQGKVIIHGRGIHAFGAGCFIHVGNKGILEIGNNFGCTGDTRITVSKRMIIGEDNLWSYNNVVMDTDGHKILDSTTKERINNAREVVFGDNVWMGCGCTILKGATIPSGSVIASRSIITKKIDGEHNIIGMQGKVINENILWER